MATIALIDDHRNILTSVDRMIEGKAFNVQTFNHGQSAYDAFIEPLFDLAVLDMKMRCLDGMDLLQRMRQKTHIASICLKSKDDKIDKILDLTRGADDRFNKPFFQGLLLERIKTLLQRKAAQDGNIHPMFTDAASEPLKARFVAGLPV